MNAPAMRLGRRHQAYLYVIGAILTLSGVLWLLFHYFVAIAGEFGPAPHPLEPWWLRVHGLSAAAFLIGFGSALPGHVRRAWAGRRNRKSGAIFLAVLAVLILTGYALYYTGEETTRALLSALHWGIGLGMPALMGVHVWRGRVWRKLKSDIAVHTHVTATEPVVRLVRRP